MMAMMMMTIMMMLMTMMMMMVITMMMVMMMMIIITMMMMIIIFITVIIINIIIIFITVIITIIIINIIIIILSSCLPNLQVMVDRFTLIPFTKVFQMQLKGWPLLNSVSRIGSKALDKNKSWQLGQLTHKKMKIKTLNLFSCQLWIIY